ncbi:NUC189-domain-containing protein [Delitschia confertaspora ATCC 74209]|uniref:NUC189-domain-containing protein n=1 Tax=Delitschia confertaspora ATCC 74209 TaxID=1513339 RepID=A0A9P4JWB4_9PLEO|nr:NUC189-domain-containing protein [Delitschia confertaspora ATCC 74209]
MVATVPSRSRAQGTTPTANRDSHPPAKKAKLSRPAQEGRQTGFKALLNGKMNTPSKSNSVKHARKDRVDEATALVRGGMGGDNGDVEMTSPAAKEVIEISSGEEDSDDSESEQVDVASNAPNGLPAAKDAPAVNGVASHGDQQMEEGTAEPEELSFAERLRAQEPDHAPVANVVDVEAAFVESNTESRVLATPSNKRPLSAPSASSLGTVLTQALRTNDQDLLDSCLRVIDVDTIYATVERLPSPLVGNLLNKLAERLHKRPGRAGMLMIWVQWSLAAHGGYLASQPQLVRQLATLNKVLKERASGLQPLLSLKGRLDMLHAQLELRKRNQKRAAQDEDEDAVIYVEGEDDSSSEEENEIDGVDVSASARKRIRQDLDEEEGESSTDEMPTTMAYHDEDDSDEGSEDSEGMIDDEAEETDNDTGDDLSEPVTDDEEMMDGEEVSESEEEARPVRRSTVGRAGLPRRY